jgi:hypothetical protein
MPLLLFSLKASSQAINEKYFHLEYKKNYLLSIVKSESKQITLV